MSRHNDVFVGRPTGQPIELGPLYSHCNVKAANVAKDLVENVRNVFGGRMHHYSRLIDTAVDEAIEATLASVRADGYQGLCDLRIATPTVVDGGVEVVIYGNAFRIRGP